MPSSREPVMAVLHLVLAVLYLPWIAMHGLVLFAATQVGGLSAGVPVLALSFGLHLLAVVALGVAAAGLLRRRPSGRTWSLLYALFATAGALLLWLTGARVWFATLLLLYPMIVLYLYLRPPEPTRATGNGSPGGGRGPAG